MAMWLGHNPAMTDATYAHVIEDLDPDERVDAVEMILQARAAAGTVAQTSAHQVPTPQNLNLQRPKDLERSSRLGFALS
ncbi:MAG: hypothetical protein ACHQAV_00005 [Solirubrobacterales bacterium]